MTSIIDKTQPPPGSDAAVSLGCTCPVLDNGRGAGRTLANGDKAYWYNYQCSVHFKHDDTSPVIPDAAAEL